MRTFSRLAALSTLTLAALAGSASASGPLDVGVIELKGSVNDRAPQQSLFGGSSGISLRDLVRAIERAKTDDKVDALLIRLRDVSMNSAQIEEIGAALKDFRASGKKVHLFSELFDTGELRLGSYADEVIVQAGGAVSLPGMHMDEMFLADMLKWVGISPDFVQVGDYKGASEMMANSRPSKAWDENINQLLDSMYGVLRDELKAGRGMDDAKLDEAMKVAWMADADEAVKVGLVDSAVDLPDLEAHIKKAYSADDVRWNNSVLPSAKREMDMSNPFAIFRMLGETPNRAPKRDTIAVLHIDGAIVDGDSTGGGLFGGEGSVGSRTVRKALAAIEDEDKIKGVVIRVDSPGGSAIASEVIWRGVKRVAAKKPVWVSVGSMAASGGYYIAVSGEKIYVNPSSIVGSIGVVGGKLALGGLMDMVKVNVVSRSRGPRADMMSMAKPWNEQDKALVRQKMTQTYDQFTARVTAGRPGIDLAKTAEGRLFTGKKAVDLKMADEIGTYQDAIGDLAAKVGLAKGSYDVLDYPAPKSFAEMLEEMMGRAAAPSVGGSLTGPMRDISAIGQQLIGPDHWRSVQTHLDAMIQLHREPVLLVSPSVILFR